MPLQNSQHRKTLLATAVCAALSAVTSPSALAAEQQLQLEEVLVTARKRQESLQETPLAVSAIGADLLEDAGITNLADVTELVPNLQIARPSRDANIYIRGVGPTRGATNVTELSVGIYLDEVFILKPQGQLMDLAEVESVQVLRGPQGTLFGKNTTGGAMLVTTVKPKEEFGGFAQVTLGNDGRRNGQLSVDVPLTDTLLSKLTVTSVKADGIGVDPVHGTELSDEDRLGALYQLRWLASDSVTADFSAFYNRIRENVLAQGDCVVTNPEAQIPGRGLVAPSGGTDLITDFCERASDSVAPYPDPGRSYELDVTHLSANVDWAINESLSLKSITAWRYQETPNIEYTNTFAGFPAGNESLKDSESTQFTQEFQLNGELLDGRVQHTTGLCFMYDDSDTGLRAGWNGDRGVWGATGGDVPAGLVAALSNYDETGQQAENKLYALFSQWTWNITEQLELTAGLRYGYEDRSIETRRQESADPWDAYAGVPGAIIIPNVTALIPESVFFGGALDGYQLPLNSDIERLENDETFESVTPMLSLSYQLPDSWLSDSINDTLVYLSYTEGYKAGGFSDFGDGQLTPFDEEDIASIELGVKMTAWDERLRFNAALFSMDYDNMQLFVARPDPDPATVGTFQGVTNAGAATIQGAEFELFVIPAANWQINMSASFADGEFDEFDDFVVDPVDGPQQVDRSDEDLPSLPESSYSIGVQYDWDTDFGAWSARVDAFYRDEIYWGFDASTWDLPIAREASTTEDYTTFNARVNWRIDEQFSIALWGKNLTDEEYYDGGVGETINIGHAIRSYAPPRRYGIDLRYEF